MNGHTKLIGYIIAILLAVASLYTYGVMANVVTRFSDGNNQLKDPFRDLILIDNQKYRILYEIVNWLPFAMSILCAVIQLYLALVRKKNFVIDALFAESISMLLKGI